MVPRSRSVRGDRLRKTITRYQSWLGTLCAQLNIAVFPPRLSSVDEAIVTFERRIAPASVFHVALITRRPREHASAYVLTCWTKIYRVLLGVSSKGNRGQEIGIRSGGARTVEALLRERSNAIGQESRFDPISRSFSDEPIFRPQ